MPFFDIRLLSRDVRCSDGSTKKGIICDKKKGIIHEHPVYTYINIYIYHLYTVYMYAQLSNERIIFKTII